MECYQREGELVSKAIKLVLNNGEQPLAQFHHHNSSKALKLLETEKTVLYSEDALPWNITALPYLGLTSATISVSSLFLSKNAVSP